MLSKILWSSGGLVLAGAIYVGQVGVDEALRESPQKVF